MNFKFLLFLISSTITSTQPDTQCLSTLSNSFTFFGPQNDTTLSQVYAIGTTFVISFSNMIKSQLQILPNINVYNNNPVSSCGWVTIDEHIYNNNLETGWILM